MNKLNENKYVLCNLWSYIKCLSSKYNLKYLIIPMVYLLIIILIVPSVEITTNEVKHKELDTYTKSITKEDKIKSILERYKLTKEQFNILSAIVLSEADKNSYEDTYAVINTIYNRTHSKNWVKSVSNRYGSNKGESLYYQAISPNQFVVYEHGTYKKNLNNTNCVGYNAIIDFLYTEEVMHSYLSFRANNVKVKNSETFSKNGNRYFNQLLDNNRI